MTDDPAFGSASLLQNAKKVIYDSGPQILYLTILILPTSYHDGYWSTMFRIALQFDINIPMAGELATDQEWSKLPP